MAVKERLLPASKIETSSKERKEESSKAGNTVNYDSYHTLCRETIHGYVFWSLFQGLGPMIWFYPLNELEISGYEAFAAMWFLPIVTGVPLILRFIQNRWVLGFLRLLSVASLASFQAPTTLSRLFILAVGAGTSMLVFTATFWNPSKRIRCSTFWGLMLGLLAFVASRVWFTSLVPTWWDQKSNSVVIAFGIIAVIDTVVTGSDEVTPEETAPVNDLQRPYSLPTALGFGSLLYLTHWCFGESSLITRWVVTGYPDSGPLPDFWGTAVLMCIGLGIYMSACRHMARSKLWWLIGTFSFGSLYYLPTWWGFTGGLLLAVYTFSVWPEMMDRLTLCPPARSLTFVVVTYLVEIFFYVWTVAFNFVPGGVYTREHTDWLITAVMLGIGLGLFAGGSTGDESQTAYLKAKNTKMPSGKVNAVLFLLLTSGLAGFWVRYQPERYRHPDLTSPKQFSAAIFTYHFGYDNKGWPSLERTAVLLNNTGADVVTLLESDASKPFLGNNDLGMWLGQRLGMYVDFGPATKDHTWGNLILSKYPIVKSKHHLLPSPHGELAPAITATINFSGSFVDFVVTHMGNDRDVLDRKLQAEFLANEIKNSPNHTVFLGYVTSSPGSRDYQTLTQVGGAIDIDNSDADRWCEYIMYKGLIRLGYARISHGGLSDTEVQVGKFEIPDDPHSYRDNTRVTTDKSKVKPDLHFNPVFGDLHHGHGYFSTNRFHMSTPKYFLP
ncbi:hypothetical protein ACJMK2_032328 [Sinanodonta woodiana]|uniref:PGAP2-interacting protein n=1 Tax=Sinanodonta woodiana TaxID=1069815 RepID=A0ABD3X4W4_SINWO